MNIFKINGDDIDDDDNAALLDREDLIALDYVLCPK